MLLDDLRSIQDALPETGLFAFVGDDPDEQRAWLDWDLASLAENRLGDTTDPRTLGDLRRSDWLLRATDERQVSVAHRSRYEQCYWLLHEGERTGTLALSRSTLGTRYAFVASFYVLPAFRGQRIGARALGALSDALAKHGLGLRLETCWCWQRSVRYYLASGMWVFMWKRDLMFVRAPDTPPPIVAFEGDRAALAVDRGGIHVTLAVAARHDDRLKVTLAPEHAKDETLGQAYWWADSTLALACALRGFPLIESQQAWDERWCGDAGAPEALAYKISVWEARTRQRGWRCDTPTIPGLRYPTWTELQVKWQQEREELDRLVVRR